METDFLVELGDVGLELALECLEGLIDEIVHHGLGGEYFFLDDAVESLDAAHEVSLRVRECTFLDLFCSSAKMRL